MQEHAAHIGFQVEGGLVVGERHDAPGSCRPDAWKLHELLHRQGQTARKLGRTGLAGVLQRKCTAVVAKPLPHLQDERRVCRGKRVGRGEEVHPALPVAHHARNLRLLQHDFRDEHPVGVVDVAPGQVAVQLGPFPLDLPDELIAREGHVRPVGHAASSFPRSRSNLLAARALRGSFA